MTSYLHWLSLPRLPTCMYFSRDEGRAIAEKYCPATVDVHCVSKSTCPLNAWVFINSGVTNSRTCRRRISFAACWPRFQLPAHLWHRVLCLCRSKKVCKCRVLGATLWICRWGRSIQCLEQKGLGSGGGTRGSAETQGDSSRDQDALFCTYKCVPEWLAELENLQLLHLDGEWSREIWNGALIQLPEALGSLHSSGNYTCNIMSFNLHYYVV